MSSILVVNPTAGRGRAARLAPEAERALAAAWGPVQVLTTTAPGTATGQVRLAVEQGAERILVLGGDGTLHEAANGVLSASVAERPPIGILPAGTGNDYAKMAGTVGLSPREAVRRLQAGRIRHFDVGEAWGEYFLNSIGIGFDAEVARVVSGWKRVTGMPAYLAAVFEILRNFSPVDVSVETDTERFADRLLLLEVAIGPCVGGGFRLTPDARPDDGLLDICACSTLQRLRILMLLPLVMLGRHTRRPQVRMLKATRVVVVSRAGPLQAQFDGELRHISDRMEIRLLPSALPVLVTA